MSKHNIMIGVIILLFITPVNSVCRDLSNKLGLPDADKSREAEFQNEFQKILKSKEGKQYIGMLQLMLLQLGYLGQEYITGKFDNDTKKAISKFQRHKGLKATGKLDSQTAHQLDKDSDLITSNDVIVVGYSFIDTFWSNNFFAEGTWSFEKSDEKMGIPIQTTKINCYRQRNLCIESTADVHFNLLGVTTEVYEIERWDVFEIITAPYDYHCARYILRINRSNKTVKKIRTTLKTKNICEGMDHEDKYLILVDGEDVYMGHMKELRKKRHQALSPSVISVLEGK